MFIVDSRVSLCCNGIGLCVRQGLELLNLINLQKINKEQNIEGLNVSPAIEKLMLGAVYSFPKYMIEHIIELSQDYDDIVSLHDIEKFKSIATSYDETYISKLISNCVNWTMKKDWDDKYQQKLKRDEIKTLERVKYRVESGR